METTIWGLGFRVLKRLTYLWLAGNDGMEKKMVTTKMGYIAKSRTGDL